MFSVFRNINRFVGKSKLLDGGAIFFARILPYIMVVFLFFYSLYIGNIYLFISPMLSGIFARVIFKEGIHFFFKVQRPSGMEGTKVLIPVPKSYSFPSGHATFFFGISFFLFFYSIQLAIIFMIASCLIGTARVFCGVHWFRDIVAGAVVGGVSAIVIHQLIKYI